MRPPLILRDWVIRRCGIGDGIALPSQLGANPAVEHGEMGFEEERGWSVISKSESVSRHGCTLIERNGRSPLFPVWLRGDRTMSDAVPLSSSSEDSTGVMVAGISTTGRNWRV